MNAKKDKGEGGDGGGGVGELLERIANEKIENHKAEKE
jgi:hypothetical protein